MQRFEAENRRLTQARSTKIVRLGWLDFVSFVATPWAISAGGWMSGAARDFTGS